MGRDRDKKEKESRGSKDKKGEDKKSKKKDKKKRRSRSSSSSSSSDEAETILANAVASAFGLKPKALILGSKVQKVADLKVYHVASVLGRQHASLTEQSLMLLGGEWFHMKKHALSSLKLSEQDPETLKVRVTLASDLAIAEKRWRDRLLAILEKVAGMNDMSVIGQHNSITSIRRAVASEIEQRMNDPETKLQWTVELKQMVTDFKKEAKKDLDKEPSGRSRSSTRAPSSSGKQKKSSGDESDGSKTSKARDSGRMKVFKPSKHDKVRGCKANRIAR
ncbi:unnamed protein product [Durusdinium trenchii]|uniref:Uncharacterized protein n=1 Tax=Durusdinium trenchii TaxID=1381693 RepID=A0ABP0NF60_9DINO